MKIISKSLYDSNNKVIGTILSYTAKPRSNENKIEIEKMIEDYATTKMFPNQGLEILRDIFEDSASIVVINPTSLISEVIDISK